ncbi:ubiquitin C-terminal hydrolase 13-like isoform X2 [Quercus suber]|uniref:ubiquitin C-terminal hydrolase 13-like isoform X2 n=1 Tax=Quercus suber TaxID=58331 RepID=UPI0032E01425
MTLMTPPPLDQQQPQPQPQPQQEDDEMLVPNTDLLEGPQPMEAQAETTSTVEAQAVDDPPSARFTWTIDNFSRLNTKKLYSDVFFVGGYKWRILVFPKGNNVDHLSMYLDVADSTNLPYGWSRYAQFSLSVINQIHNKYSIRKGILSPLSHIENWFLFSKLIRLDTTVFCPSMILLSYPVLV